MGLDYPGLLSDFRQESDTLISCLHDLTPEQWQLATPAAGWSVLDQISHLAFFDDTARLAASDAEQFRCGADELMAGGMDFPDRIAASYRSTEPAEILAWFIAARADLIAAFEADEPQRRLPWFGPDMSVASSATARFMETWAHGQDVYDTLQVTHPASAGLRNIAHLGVATFAFSHKINGLPVPTEPVRVELLSPHGEGWSWGPHDASDRVSGAAEDFVLAVTQRRHWTETALTVAGPVATAWLDIAQAFAGAPSQRKVAQ
jgi:uncharacterized protein (TIGR03084 family)